MNKVTRRAKYDLLGVPDCIIYEKSLVEVGSWNINIA
jgi:hypothetical protein